MAECCKDSEVDINAIIKEIMREKKVTPEEIDKDNKEKPFVLEEFLKDLKDRSKWSLRYFRGRAYAQFKCGNEFCDNLWSSNRAWCILDLKKQKMKLKLKQECTLYEEHPDFKYLSLSEKQEKKELDFKDDSVGAFPSFEDEKSARYMVEWAVNKYLELVGRKERVFKNYDSQRQVNAPHKQSLCEMCQAMGGPCWE